MPERIILHEDFDSAPDGGVPDGWWVEGGERVWVENGRLRVKADPEDAKAPGGVCTVWHKTPFGGDARIEFDAHVVSSSVDANNINLFLFYSDPSGRPLFDTRTARAGAGYDLYHNLNGYIVTFLNDVGTVPPSGTVPTPRGTMDSCDSNGMTGQSQTAGQSLRARVRMRRCPGFRLVAETFGYHCRQGVTYHVEVERRGGRLTYSVDGHLLLDWTDPEPLAAGHLGLRTYRTDLWWDNLRVTALD